MDYVFASSATVATFQMLEGYPSHFLTRHLFHDVSLPSLLLHYT